MSWEDIKSALDHLNFCNVNGCEDCKKLSSDILEITQEKHKEKLQQIIKERLEELDDKLQTAFMQYNLSMAGYRYAQISELSKLLDDKQFIKKHMPMTIRIRAFCNLIGETIAYTNAGEYETLDSFTVRGD